MEARKIEIRRQKNRYQDNFSCQSSKPKIRNVANNYEKKFFYHILKWKHPSIWQLFWCDGKLPFDDYDLYLSNACVTKFGTFSAPNK